jgi:NAD(P)-dependent dehydrogenase (short-subunit alcohol dehydrogenase family)
MSYFGEKIALVTGAASGIGRALAEELSRRGATVIVSDLNLDGATEVSSAINRSGGRASAAMLDVTREDDVVKLVDDTVAQYGRLDFIFNNAGIGVGGEARDLTVKHWRRIVDINLFGVIHGTNAAYAVMVKQGFGHIVNTGSLAELIGAPTMTPYATTKYAVVGMSTSLRAEAEGLGVKVSVVCPGFIQTGIFEAATFARSNSQTFLNLIPFRLMDAHSAARKILRGVERNRAIIVFPAYARLFWWLGRISPGLIAPLGRKTVNDFRRTRSDSPDNDQ